MSEIVKGYLGLYLLLFLTFGSASLLSTSADAARASLAADRYLCLLEEAGDREAAIGRLVEEAKDRGYGIKLAPLSADGEGSVLTLTYAYRIPMFHFSKEGKEVRIIEPCVD